MVGGSVSTFSIVRMLLTPSREGAFGTAVAIKLPVEGGYTLGRMSQQNTDFTMTSRTTFFALLPYSAVRRLKLFILVYAGCGELIVLLFMLSYILFTNILCSVISFNNRQGAIDCLCGLSMFRTSGRVILRY